MSAIVTRYKGPTDSKGARIVASCHGYRVTTAYDHGLTEGQNHRVSAERLRDRQPVWSPSCEMVSDIIAAGEYVHVPRWPTHDARVVADVADALWPDGRTDAEWDSDTVSDVASILRLAGHAPTGA